MIKQIDDFILAVRTHYLSKPISIEITEEHATAIRSELAAMLKYQSKNTGLKHNEAMYKGLLLIAPNNFIWTT